MKTETWQRKFWRASQRRLRIEAGPRIKRPRSVLRHPPVAFGAEAVRTVKISFVVLRNNRPVLAAVDAGTRGTVERSPQLFDRVKRGGIGLIQGRLHFRYFGRRDKNLFRPDEIL